MPKMGKVVSKYRTRTFINQRREAHQRVTRENIASQLKAIEAKAVASSAHNPIHPHRPYGLPEGMAGARVDIWDLIFHKGDYDLSMIVNLREVCKLFNELLEREYVPARLPEVIEKCLARNVIRWKAGRMTKNTYAKTLSKLRTLSTITKKSVDRRFDRGLLRVTDASDYSWFLSTYPNYCMDDYKIPTLMLGGLNIEQRRLWNALNFLENHNAPENLRAVVFEESTHGGVPLDLLTIRNEFHGLLEKVGLKIISFQYCTREGPQEAYANLRRFASLMPNLQEMMIAFFGPRPDEDPENVEPFPVCKDLRRYAEGPEGFNYCYLKEIFKANPRIRGVHLGKSLSNVVEVHKIKGLLETLPLTCFHCTCMPVVNFFGHRFPWTNTVRTLCFWETRGDLGPDVCTSSNTLFKFISSCKNLSSLCVSTPLLLDTGGYLDLPKLYCLFWKVLPQFKSLEFLRLAARFGVLLDVVACPELHDSRAFFRFLEDQYIPSLFPALREIRVLNEEQGNWKIVWEHGALC